MADSASSSVAVEHVAAHLDQRPGVGLDAPDAYRAGLATIRHALMDMQAAVEAATDPEEVARFARLIAITQQDLRLLDDTAIGRLHNLVPAVDVDAGRGKTRRVKQLTIEGVGTVECGHAASNNAWDQDRLWGAAVDVTIARLTDTETGEVPSPDVETAIRVAVGEVRAMKVAGPWSKTGLRARGIDPEDVSTQTWGKRTIRWHTST